MMLQVGPTEEGRNQACLEIKTIHCHLRRDMCMRYDGVK